MKVLVIGSKGFIGSSVVKLLREKEYVVMECDVMVDYANDQYFLIDATNADYHDIFRSHQFEAVINCSGAANVGDSLKNPLRDYTLNTYNVFKLLDALRIYQPNCKFLNLSSAAIYGNPERLPVCEDFEARPISPYGLHKLHAEEIGREFHSFFGMSTCSLRIFSAYGPGLKKQLFWDIYQKASNYEVIELFGSGNESRDFIYIDDLVQAIQCCLHRARFEGEIINVANGKDIRIDEAVDIFLSCFPGKKEIFFNKLVKKGDPLYWKADISTLKQMGYKQQISLQEGLNNYYNWISQL